MYNKLFIELLALVVQVIGVIIVVVELLLLLLLLVVVVVVVVVPVVAAVPVVRMRDVSYVFVIPRFVYFLSSTLSANFANRNGRVENELTPTLSRTEAFC